MKLCPEVTNFTNIELLDRSTLRSLQEASSSTSSEWQILKRAHLVYTYFAHCLLTQNSDKACVLSCIGASSTDNFPQESIENTIEPNERVDMRFSYWSSGGQRDPNVQESLVYRLGSGLYTISEIRIQPFKGLIFFFYIQYFLGTCCFRPNWTVTEKDWVKWLQVTVYSSYFRWSPGLIGDYFWVKLSIPNMQLSWLLFTAWN